MVAFMLYIMHSDHLFSFGKFQTVRGASRIIRRASDPHSDLDLSIRFPLLLSPQCSSPASLLLFPFLSSSPVYHTLTIHHIS